MFVESTIAADMVDEADPPPPVDAKSTVEVMVLEDTKAVALRVAAPEG